MVIENIRLINLIIKPQCLHFVLTAHNEVLGSIASGLKTRYVFLYV